MPDIREKPTTVREKSVKPKGRTSGKAIHAASRQITAKYRKELARHDQKKSDNSTETEAAVDCTTQAVGKAVSQSVRALRGTAVKTAAQIKTWQRAAGQQSDISANILRSVARQTEQPPQEKMRRFVVQKYRKKYRMAQQEQLNELRIPHKAMATEPVESSRPALPVSEAAESTRTPLHPSIHQSNPTLSAPTSGERLVIREKLHSTAMPKIKTHTVNTTIKTRQLVESRVLAPAGPYVPVASKPVPSNAKALIRQRARKHAQRQAQVLLLKKQQQTAKTTAAIAKRLGEAAVQTAKAMVSAVAGLFGGGVLLMLVCVVMLVAAVVASPFGILFTTEPSPGSITLNAAVAQINVEYNEKLEELQSGDYDSVQLHGAPPEWRQVVAVFAAKTAGANDGVDVATLDEDRIDRLRKVFWDMTEITTRVETIDHGDSVERILHITITAKTADEMRTIYRFTKYQNEGLDALLDELGVITGLLGDLNIRQEDAVELLKNLPANLSPERRAVIEHALTLVGKVNYFWGGKSLVLGWDSRWGTTMQVTAAGSSSSGTYRPYGLDCSGFADWVFYNATGGSYIIGHGGGAASQHSYCKTISWSQAQPGDLVFYPGDTHVGIVGGRDTNGNLLIIHCASGANNVVITGASGFTSIGRPQYFGR